LFEKIKVFLKNQKHEPNIVEITHLCIMHGAHTSTKVKDDVIVFREAFSHDPSIHPSIHSSCHPFMDGII
jgi:hypothetical protein